MIHHDFDLFHGIYNTKNEHNRGKLITFHQFQMILISIFKACVFYFHQIFIFSSNDSSLKTMKNAFYFI